MKNETPKRYKNIPYEFAVRELFVHERPNLSISVNVPDETWFPVATPNSVNPCY